MAKRSSEKSTTPIVSTEIAAEPTLSSTTPSTSDEASAIELPDFLKQFTRAVITDEQIQKATQAFELRLHELTELHSELSDLASAARRFKATPESFSNAARSIHDTLNRILAYSTMDLSPNRASRTALFRRCADCLHSLNNVLSVLDFRDLSEHFQNLLRCLNKAQELEQMGYDNDLEHLEEAIWEDCLPAFLQEIEVITARLSIEIESNRDVAMNQQMEVIDFGGVEFRIDQLHHQISRVCVSGRYERPAEFGNKRDTDSWRVAEALIRACGKKVDVSSLAPQLKSNSRRALIARLRSDFMPIGVEIESAGAGHWMAKPE